MNVTDLFDQLGDLSPDTKKTIKEAFDQAVEARAKEVAIVEKETALAQLDENHAAQLTQLLEELDKNHSAKLTTVVKTIDEQHAEKLDFIVRKYKKIINEDAKQFKEDLIKKVSNYMDIYLKESIPKEELVEAVNNKQAAKILNRVKQLVSLDEDFVKSTIRDAVADGAQRIRELQEELQTAVKNNIQVNEEVKKAKSALILERSTVNFPAEKREYVMRAFKQKDPEYITENIDHVIKMFERTDSEQVDVLVEDATRKSKTLANKIDTPKSVGKVIVESSQSVGKTDNKEDAVGEYLNCLAKQDA